jgi:very-short-patch-repair endonuclease
MDLFHHFFELHSKMNKDDEKYQLLLCDGFLKWNSEREPLDHPILSQKVALRFDAEVPRFTVTLDPEAEVKIASHILRFHGLSGQVINETKEAAETGSFDLTEAKKIKDILKSFVHKAFQDGEYVDSEEAAQQSDKPSIRQKPCLLLAKKSQSVAEVFDKLMLDVPPDREHPVVLQRIVGMDPKVDRTSESLLNGSNADSESSFEFFQTKPANEEQFRIVQTLEKTGNVLVQGPPGTGKSHTIANLIGHLLAKGQRILVTSHTSKALNVVREKVVEPLRPLCVANLSNDSESRAQLKDSVTGIVNYLGKTDETKLKKRIAELTEKRQQAKQQVADFERQVLAVIKSEYAEVLIPGEEPLTPIQAAKFLQQNLEQNWIPQPVSSNAALPISPQAIDELYEANGLMSQSQESCLKEGLLDNSNLPKPSEFSKLAKLKESVSSQTDDEMLTFFDLSVKIDEELLTEFTEELESNLESIIGDEWTRNIFEELVIDRNRTGPWLELIDIIEDTYQEITRNENLIMSLDPAIHFEWTEELYQAAVELSDQMYAKGRVGWLSKILNPKWRLLLKNSTIEGKPPFSGDGVRAISYLYKNQIDREKLLRRWNRQMVTIGAPAIDGPKPELKARPQLKKLEAVVHWHTETWDHALDVFDQIGFRVEDAMDDRGIDSRASSESLIKFLLNTIVPSLKTKLNYLKLTRINAQVESVHETLDTSQLSSQSLSFYAKDLRKSLETFDSELYQEAYDKLDQLTRLKSVFAKREQSLQVLDEHATEWAKALRARNAPHNSAEVLGDASLAWKFAQISQELDERQRFDYNELQDQLEIAKKHYVDINSEYVKCLSWGYQLKRTGLTEKQALVGWQQLQEKMTMSGRGKLDSRRRKEAQAQLKTCKNSVPVWIMPLSKVYESFDFARQEFDVLILDEASQSDITSIIALGIAKEVVIVGDKEQVTPTGIGQDLEQIQGLIDEYLDGIPNKIAYDGKTSIYDIAEQSFGDSIRLIEHFRCVPDIINFSNFLSYAGEIKPLREASDGQFDQPLVEHRVDGHRGENKKTNKTEALEVASLIAAMTQHPDYKNTSIGVISLLGSQQANQIDSILRQRLSPRVYEKHNILCGDSANFQGDERDVMFLSMVDSCDNPPLRILQQDSFKKRYNVAVSRARDQLWLVHSLNYETDLKVGDLRQELITHFRNPKGKLDAIATAADLSDSEFEKRVQKDLISRGYNIIPHWEVGAFLIDLVVASGDKRIAIECDGEKYHTKENLVDDLHRQGILERLGWHFVRIRGSEYFRDPEKSIERVIASLEAHGIQPGSDESAKVKPKSAELIHQLQTAAKQLRDDWSKETSTQTNDKIVGEGASDEFADESVAPSSQEMAK